MFTGIVEEIGRLTRRDGHRFTFEAPTVAGDATAGASVAVNGCCLTVVDHGPGWWSVDVVDETLARTNLADLAPGDEVNLERPVKLGERLGGHLVQGHVDAVGEVVAGPPGLEIHSPAALKRYVVEKGSICVDGCSLTVARLTTGGFAISIVPHTAAVTTLGRRQPGDRVNLEVDLVAKYVESLLTRDGPRTGA